MYVYFKIYLKKIDLHILQIMLKLPKTYTMT